MTGCCIANWHIEETDFSKVNCRYVFTQFNYTTKSPTDRYPVGRDLEVGELGRQYEEDSALLDVHLTEAPNWEALAFTLAQIDRESNGLGLTVKAYESSDEHYLVRLKANRLVNAKMLSRRIFQLYPEVLQRLFTHQTEICNLLALAPRAGVNLALKLPPQAAPPELKALPSPDRRIRLYQEVVRQIQHIMMSQNPEQFVHSVQELLNYLSRQGIATEDIQRKVISQVITQRARQDKSFRAHMQRWETTAPEAARLSTVGQAVRLAIALMWSEPKKSEG